MPALVSYWDGAILHFPLNQYSPFCFHQRLKREKPSRPSGWTVSNKWCAQSSSKPSTNPWPETSTCRGHSRSNMSWYQICHSASGARFMWATSKVSFWGIVSLLTLSVSEVRRWLVLRCRFILHHYRQVDLLVQGRRRTLNDVRQLGARCLPIVGVNRPTDVGEYPGGVF